MLKKIIIFNSLFACSVSREIISNILDIVINVYVDMTFSFILLP